MSIYNLALVKEEVFVVTKEHLTKYQIKKVKKIQEMLMCLQEDCRMPLTNISKRIGIPQTTIHDWLIRLKKKFTLAVVLVEKKEKEKSWKELQS